MASILKEGVVRGGIVSHCAARAAIKAVVSLGVKAATPGIAEGLMGMLLYEWTDEEAPARFTLRQLMSQGVRILPVERGKWGAQTVAELGELKGPGPGA